MQNILNRLAKANKAQTKLNKNKNLLKGRKIHLSLKDDLDSSGNALLESYNKANAYDVQGAVNNIQFIVGTLKSALAAYRQMESDYMKYSSTFVDFEIAMEELGLDASSFENEMTESDALYLFEESQSAIVDLESIVSEIESINQDWPSVVD